MYSQTDTFENYKDKLEMNVKRWDAPLTYTDEFEYTVPIQPKGQHLDYAKCKMAFVYDGIAESVKLLLIWYFLIRLGSGVKFLAIPYVKIPTLECLESYSYFLCSDCKAPP